MVAAERDDGGANIQDQFGLTYNWPFGSAARLLHDHIPDRDRHLVIWVLKRQAEEELAAVKHSPFTEEFGFLGFQRPRHGLPSPAIAIIITLSFQPHGPRPPPCSPLHGFTTKWYVEVVQNRSFLQALKNSVYWGSRWRHLRGSWEPRSFASDRRTNSS